DLLLSSLSGGIIMRHLNPLIFVLLVAVALAAACGSSPTSPSGAVRVKGTVLDVASSLQAPGAQTAQSEGPVASSGAHGRISVTVQGTSLNTTVSGNGTFEIEGLSAGTFTLVFTRDGVTLGSVTVTASSEVTIVVKIEASSVTVVKLEIDGQDKDADDTKTC